MNIKVNSTLMIPIYEQIVDQIKTLIRIGKLEENDMLPSVRSLSKELKISALTVKKAYDYLESEGFVVTVHGKGTYVAASNSEIQKEVELDIEMAVKKARRYGISDEDIKGIFSLVIDEN
jgi:GntR family transcriptional regulator